MALPTPSNLPAPGPTVSGEAIFLATQSYMRRKGFGEVNKEFPEVKPTFKPKKDFSYFQKLNRLVFGESVDWNYQKNEK